MALVGGEQQPEPEQRYAGGVLLDVRLLDAWAEGRISDGALRVYVYACMRRNAHGEFAKIGDREMASKAHVKRCPNGDGTPTLGDYINELQAVAEGMSSPPFVCFRVEKHRTEYKVPRPGRVVDNSASGTRAGTRSAPEPVGEDEASGTRTGSSLVPVRDPVFRRVGTTPPTPPRRRRGGTRQDPPPGSAGSPPDGAPAAPGGGRSPRSDRATAAPTPLSPAANDPDPPDAAPDPRTANGGGEAAAGAGVSDAFLPDGWRRSHGDRQADGLRPLGEQLGGLIARMTPEAAAAYQDEMSRIRERRTQR